MFVKNTGLTLLLFMTTLAGIAQNAPFQMMLSPADSAREAGDLKKALEEFKKTAAREPENANNLYNYACALAIMRQPDSSLFYLNKSVELETYPSALTDPDFNHLRSDKRWDEFETHLLELLAKKNQTPPKNRSYAKALWHMMAKDQAYYHDLDLVEKKCGMYSTIMMALWDYKHLLNTENQEEFVRLYAQYGWPVKSDVGEIAARGAFLIIQHSDLEQQKKYLPDIENLCKKKEAEWQSYALMYDRIQTEEHKPQKYGSQIRFNEQTRAYELCPLLDETQVDAWRKEIGLMPLGDYLARWKITFRPGTH